MLQHQPCRCLLSMSQRDKWGRTVDDEKSLEDGHTKRVPGRTLAKSSITQSWNDEPVYRRAAPRMQGDSVAVAKTSSKYLHSMLCGAFDRVMNDDRPANGQTKNERPLRVLHKPHKLITFRRTSRWVVSIAN